MRISERIMAIGEEWQFRLDVIYAMTKEVIGDVYIFDDDSAIRVYYGSDGNAECLREIL